MPRTLSEQEFNAARDKAMASLPKGLTEPEFQRLIGPAMEQALGEAENTDPAVEGSATRRFLTNAGEVLNPVAAAKGIYHAVTDPVGTVVGVGQQMADQWSKAGTALEQGQPREALARAVSGSVPLVGPLVADIGEQVGRGDYAGAAGRVTGLAVPFGAQKALSARATSRAATKAPMLEREAAQQVAGQVLAPGNPKYRGQAQDIAPGILARGMRGNRLELQQAALEGMDDAAMRIDAAVDAAGGVKGVMPVQEILVGLRQRMGELKDSAGNPLSSQAAVRIKKIEERVRRVQALGGRKGVVTYEDLKKIRDENYRIATEARGYEKAGNLSMVDEGYAAREAGSVIRDVFGRRIPDSMQPNADYAFFKTLNDILDPAIGRPKNMTPTAGVTGGARTTGAVIGAMTGSKAATFVASVVLPWVKERMADASWQLADAHSKMRLAQAMKRGDIGLMQSVMVNMGKAKVATSSSQSQTPPTPAMQTP